MDKKESFFKKNLRTFVQVISAAAANGYTAGFANAEILKGASKFACVPGLNCYSCPGALASYPPGALQNTIAARDKSFVLYAISLIFLFGAILGRFTCGWLCSCGAIKHVHKKKTICEKPA